MPKTQKKDRVPEELRLSNKGCYVKQISVIYDEKVYSDCCEPVVRLNDSNG